VLSSTLVFWPPKEVEADIVCVCMAPRKGNGEVHLVAWIYCRPVAGLEDGDEVLQLLLLRAGKQGFEATRRGGALGQCKRESPSFKKFLSIPGILPRQRKAAVLVIINSATKCGFFSLYRREQGVVVYWYNTPQAGGNQMLKQSQLEDSKLLSAFPFCCLLAALVCTQVNKMNLLPRPVIPSASAKLLAEFMECRDTTRAELGNLGLWNMALNSKHSLVCYAVGFHIDVFAEKGTDVIENKIVLVARKRSDLTTPKPLGRGGLGDGMYVFALLDWEAPTRARRRRYIIQQRQRHLDKTVGVDL
jgi:hypothetical protein